MDTLKIKAVLRAVKYGSLSKAALEFSYTPSAFSHSVDSLEKELGVKLLTRSHKGVKLTKDGELLLEKLEAVVGAEEDLFRSASAIAETQNNQLRIGTYASISVNLLPGILKGFIKQHPEVSISILVDNRIGSWVEEDIADVLFCIKYENLEWLPIVRDDYVAVLPESLFEGKTEVSFEELYPYSFITTENLNFSRELDLGRFKELVQLSSDDDMSAVSMVQAGMGVTILPSLVLKNQAKGIRTLKLKTGFYRTLGIGYQNSSNLKSSVKKFIRYLRTERKDDLLPMNNFAESSFML